MFPQIPQGHTLRQSLLHQLAGRVREQDLPPVSGAHNASSMMHIQSSIALRRELRLARMHTDAHPNGNALGPGITGQSALDGDGRENRIGGTSKDHEEGITLRVDFVAAPLTKCRSQQLAIVGQHADIPISQLL